MEIRRITFEAQGYSIDCWPAIPQINPLYLAASQAFLRHHTLALQMGRVSEERAEELFAKCYAEGVIAGSPSPEFAGFTRKDWVGWLVANTDQFRTLRSICEVQRNFEDPSGKADQGASDGANRRAGATA